LELAAIASIDSGTIIPDAILLFKKHFDSLSQCFSSSTLCAVSQVLLPSLCPSMAKSCDFVMADGHVDRIKKCLEILGYMEDGSLLVGNGSIDGICVDFVFPAHKTCIMIERESVYNVSSKKASVSGKTAMIANIMAQRKGWKVIVVIPELYTDDKSLISLLGEPLKRIPINSDIIFDGELSNISPNQKIRSLKSQTGSLVDLGKLVFHILRNSVTVQSIVVANLVCGDQAFNLLLNEFLATYVVKHKSDLTIYVDSPGRLSAEAVVKLVEGLNFSGNASGGLGQINLRIGTCEEVRKSVVAWWSEAHTSSPIKLIDGSVAGSPYPSSNVIILS
jgi:hypothetical protein